MTVATRTLAMKAINHITKQTALSALPLPQISLCCIFGILPLLWLPQLPPWWCSLLLVLLVIGGLAVSLWAGTGDRRWTGNQASWRTSSRTSRWAILRYPAISLLCFAWALLAGQQALWPLAHISRVPQQVQVRILQTDGATHHQAEIIRLHDQRIYPPIPLTLTSRRLPVTICAGQRWQMQVKLQAIRGQLNDGSFDRLRHSVAQHQVLTGRMTDGQPLNDACNLRARYLRLVADRVQQRQWGGVMMALGFGERADLSQQVKELLRNTATAHLMAISGLHIGFAALLGGWLVRLLQWLLPVHAIGHRLPLLGGVLLAMLYTWLSGANPPAQRSLVALIVWATLKFTGRQWHPWQVWLCCLAAVLFVDPLSVISDSFWLSAFAVAALIFCYQWLPFNSKATGIWRYLLALLHLQCALLLLLLPLQLLLFHGVSLSSIAANVLAVPLVAMLALPLILAAMLFSLLPWAGLAEPLWWLADQCLALVFSYLQHLPAGWLTLDQRFRGLSLLPWLAIILWRMRFTLIPPATVLALLLWLGLPFFSSGDKADWSLHVLDLGTAQAVVIERHHQALLYDSGTAWPGGDSAGQTLIPWLQWHHLTPQLIFVSDDEFDKYSSLQTLHHVWQQMQVITPAPLADSLNASIPLATLCVRGQQWHWQGLLVEAHWPLPPDTATASDSATSCVIKVSDGQHSVLLTGRLDHASEQAMLRYHWDKFQAQVMLVPAQGSNHASSSLLLSRVNGSLALASLSQSASRSSSLAKVKQRYAQQGYQWYDTAHSGQISLHFSAQGWQIQTLRQHIQPRWYHQYFRLADES